MGNSNADACPQAAPQEPDPEAIILSLSEGQHGVVTRAQLVEAGVAEHLISYRVKKRRLRPLYRGVYRVGPVRARYEREMAAVLACGETAVVSHRSAAAVLRLLPEPLAGEPVDITVHRGYPCPGPSVRLHRVRPIGPDDKTKIEGVPITAPARTLFDLAGPVSSGELERALASAVRSGILEGREVMDLLTRYPRRPGARRLRALLEGADVPPLTRSEGESRFLTLVRKAKVPRPEVNVRVKAYEVDFLWRRERVVVEIDGFAYHSSRGAFEQDRHRDAVLAAAGFLVVRITWRQLTTEPEAFLVLLAQALARIPAV